MLSLTEYAGGLRRRRQRSVSAGESESSLHFITLSKKFCDRCSWMMVMA